MDLREIYSYNCGNNGKFPRISFEAVVPENGDVAELFEKLRAVKKYNPVLISLSIGENTQMQGLPIEFLKMVLDLELNVLPNISISNLSKELVEHYITRIENLGIENILVTEGIPSVDFENNDAGVIRNGIHRPVFRGPFHSTWFVRAFFCWCDKPATGSSSGSVLSLSSLGLSARSGSFRVDMLSVVSCALNSWVKAAISCHKPSL